MPRNRAPNVAKVEVRQVVSIGRKSVVLINKNGKRTHFPRNRVLHLSFDTPATATVHWAKDVEPPLCNARPPAKPINGWPKS